MSKRNSVREPVKLTVIGVSDGFDSGRICVGDTITFYEGFFEPISRWERFKTRWKMLKLKLINR